MKNYLLISGLITLTCGCATEASFTQPTVQPSTVASPVSSTPKQSIKSGTFVAGEHETTGGARIVRENGRNYLELDKTFKTSPSGPDLFVILHRSDDVLATTQPPVYPLKTGDYVILARLQNYSGAQRYPIASNINLANYQSAVIWCRQFNATFGTAKLNASLPKK